MDDSVTASLKSLWLKPIGSLPTCTDLGRLAKRIDVLEKGEVKNHPTENGDSSPNAWYLGRAFQMVALNLECSELYPKVLEAIKHFETAAGNQPDLEPFIRDLFSSLDETGPTVRVFKLINQAALAAAITPLKLSAASRSANLRADMLMTKDVRSADGWRISIDIGDNEICVTHTRREQSLVSDTTDSLTPYPASTLKSKHSTSDEKYSPPNHHSRHNTRYALPTPEFGHAER